MAQRFCLHTHACSCALSTDHPRVRACPTILTSFAWKLSLLKNQRTYPREKRSLCLVVLSSAPLPLSLLPFAIFISVWPKGPHHRPYVRPPPLLFAGNPTTRWYMPPFLPNPNFLCFPISFLSPSRRCAVRARRTSIAFLFETARDGWRGRLLPSHRNYRCYYLSRVAFFFFFSCLSFFFT